MSGALFTILSLIVVLGVLVFIHEAGHFLAAKAAGIHVHRFSLGIGAPIRWLTITRGGTEYSISWLPLGGYVKMASREEDAAMGALEGEATSAAIPPDQVFEAKPVWVRMIVILAGVTMNALFAWLVFSSLLYRNGEAVTPVTRFGALTEEALPPEAEGLRTLTPGDSITAINGRPVSSWNEIQQGIQRSAGDSVVVAVAGRAPVVLPIHQDALDQRIRAAVALQPYLTPVIGQIVQDGPADRAGLQPGDTILAVDSVATPQWAEVVGLLGERAGDSLTVTVSRRGDRVRVTLVPDASPTDTLADGRARGIIGVVLASPTRRDPVTLAQALAGGWRETANWSTQIVRSVRGMLFGRVSSRDVGGPILIGQLAAQTARAGFEPFLAFMAVISVNLAVLNLLPIPVLDGGQFLFLLGEAVLRRPLSLKLRERLTMVGLALILALMVLAFSNDIRRLLGL